MKNIAFNVSQKLGIFLVLGLFTLAATPALAQHGSVGIGGQLGDPSGLSLKIYRTGGSAIELLASYDSEPDWFFLSAHWQRERAFSSEPQFHYFYGPGLFVEWWDAGADDEVGLGISGNFGINYYIDQFELFGQLTPRLLLAPETDGDLGGGIGVRFYF